MGNNWIWPVVIIGGVVIVGGYLLLQSVGSAFSNPQFIQGIHALTSEQGKQIAQDLGAGKITQEQAIAKFEALRQSKVNYARFSI